MTGTPSRQPPSVPAASPTLIVFVQVGTDAAGDLAGEVRAPADLDRFLVGPAATDQQVRDAVRRHRTAGVRMFAFLLNGCQNDGASLVVQPTRLYAVLTGGVGVQCLVPETYLAVFTVPDSLVPAGARIG